jgi:DNA invertase Pin-like site-specific DNA recombinase
MSRLLDYAVEGDPIVVRRIDRLGRSLIDVLNTVKMLQQSGINLQSVSDGIDPSTKTGRMMFGMLATLAEYERES